MFPVTDKTRLNISHKLIALVSILVILVLYIVWSWLLPETLCTEQRELPVHTPTSTVVSISTFSQHVFHMCACLDSIFAQSQLPDRVIITIP